MKRLRLALFIFSILLSNEVSPCQCPVTVLDAAECAKYDIIFRGTIKSVRGCGDRPGEAVFEIQELYKGMIAKEFMVVFNCDEPCAQKILPGQEWIIYSHYRQLNNASMDWCSRSRMRFLNEREDFYTVNNGNDFETEVNFLRKNLGLHRFYDADPAGDNARNQRPGTKQMIVILLISLTAIILFYWLFNRFFR